MSAKDRHFALRYLFLTKCVDLVYLHKEGVLKKEHAPGRKKGDKREVYTVSIYSIDNLFAID